MHFVRNAGADAALCSYKRAARQRLNDNDKPGEPMEIGQIFLLLGCAIVGLILLRGLWNMLQGGPGNTSQKLMRMRVMAQGLVVFAIVVVVYLSR